MSNSYAQKASEIRAQIKAVKEDHTLSSLFKQIKIKHLESEIFQAKARLDNFIFNKVNMYSRKKEVK